MSSVEIFDNLKVIKNIPSNGREGRIDLVKLITGEEMILKTLGVSLFAEFPESRGGAVLEKYKRLKEAGLPVVPELIVSKDDRRILMTDITEGGKKIIIDKNWLINLKNKCKPKIENINELRNEIYKISDQAYEKADVLLDYDAYSILFDPITTVGKVCLIDLGEHSFPLVRGSIQYVEEDAHSNAKEFIKLFNNFPNVRH